MKKLALVALLVAACGTLNTAQAHTLTLAFKGGDTYRYKFASTSKQTAAMSGMTVPIQLDATAGETVTVNSVDPSGVADLSISLSDFTLKSVAGGITNTTSGMPAPSIDVKVRPDGTVESIDGNSVMGGSPLAAFAGVGGGFFIAAVLPDKAVKIGDTWSKTYDQTDPKGLMTIHITSNSKYLRDEKVGSITTAVVETRSTGTMGMTGAAGNAAGMSMNGTFTTDVTTWIDPSGHRVVKSHSISTDEVTINLPTGPPAAAGESPPPIPIQGPVTAKGEGTSDLTSA